MRIRSALFVDFDNVYVSLDREDREAARLFATDPLHWLSWLANFDPEEDREREEAIERSILLRRCYLNPRSFGRFRSFFVNAGFHVVDCPPVTAKGKNSGDIQMVMDMLDALGHETRFDEFIIMSGDADFRPVALRLRAHDRRTAIFTVGQASAAYRASCDVVIDEELFLEEALGVTGVEDERETAPRQREVPAELVPLLSQMAARLEEEVRTRGAQTPGELPRLYKEFPEFARDDNWLGFYGLRPLTEHLVSLEPTLTIAGSHDEWRVVPAEDVAEEFAQSPEEAASEDEALAERVLELVRELVEEADKPVVMARAASMIRQRLGASTFQHGWAGSPTFKGLLLRREDELLGLRISHDTPGYLYDPQRHEAPAPREDRAPLAGLTEEVAALAHQVVRVTGCPELSSEEYALVFRAAAEELAERRYHLTRTSKAIRDATIDAGRPISRIAISFVLKGIVYAGLDLDDTPREISPIALGRAFATNVGALAEARELSLEERDRARLEHWIVGGLDLEHGSSAEPREDSLEAAFDDDAGSEEDGDDSLSLRSTT